MIVVPHNKRHLSWCLCFIWQNIPLYIQYNRSATKNGRTVALQSGSTSPVYIDGELCRCFRKEALHMITLSYEALIALIAVCGGAGYMLGKDVSKAKK